MAEYELGKKQLITTCLLGPTSNAGKMLPSLPGLSF